MSACLELMLSIMNRSSPASPVHSVCSMQNWNAVTSSWPAVILSSRWSVLSSILSSILLPIMARMNFFAALFIGLSSDFIVSQPSSSVASSTTPSLQSSSAYSWDAKSSSPEAMDVPARRVNVARTSMVLPIVDPLLSPSATLSKPMLLTLLSLTI